MYKEVKVTGVIGAFCAEGRYEVKITIGEIKNIMSKVNEKDKFISTQLSRKGIIQAFKLVDSEIPQTFNTSIQIPKDISIQSRFIREYYKMDFATRSVLSQIIKDFKNGEIKNIP